MSDERCGVVAAIADLVPVFRREDLGVALYYRQDADNKVDLTWREGQWLWTLRDKLGKLKGYGHAQAGQDAMRMALTAAGFANAPQAADEDRPRAIAPAKAAYGLPRAS